MFALLASFGAVSAMILSAPTSFYAQPRNILGGHVIASVATLTLDYFVNPEFFEIIPEWIGAAIAPAITTGLMTKFGLLHPPAVAVTVLYITSDEQVSFGFPFCRGRFSVQGSRLLVSNKGCGHIYSWISGCRGQGPGVRIASSCSQACSSGWIDDCSQVKGLGWMFFATPVLFDCFVAVFFGAALNNLSKYRVWPLYW